jgi:predicted RNA polymerase sigma factor
MDFEPMNLPGVNALMALMCFHASRFTARKGEDGNMILYGEQDESQWDQALIARGAEYLKNASKGRQLTKYHLEANIAYWHTIKADTPEKWNNILQLYNRLLMMEYSPVAALNRTYALYKVNGREAAIAEAEKLKLTGNRYYFTLLGELYLPKDVGKALAHFQNALKLATTDHDRATILEKIERITLVSNS